ncbi:MAG: PEP-CTERM sorting domain-containing protein [Gemmataceae bacterium]|nr:PEP-CTERM sorting domain-containing protein [Gemmataceae bacterium]
MTILAPAAAVPEPATVGMMALGCMASGAVVRRFRRPVA